MAEITIDVEMAKRLKEVGSDIAGTIRVVKLNIKVGKPKLAERVLAVEPELAKLGPRLRTDVELIVHALREAKPEDLAKQLTKGKIKLRAGGKRFELAPEDVRVIKEISSVGRKVDVIDIQEPALTLLIAGLLSGPEEIENQDQHEERYEDPHHD